MATARKMYAGALHVHEQVIAHKEAMELLGPAPLEEPDGQADVEVEALFGPTLHDGADGQADVEEEEPALHGQKGQQHDWGSEAEVEAEVEPRPKRLCVPLAGLKLGGSDLDVAMDQAASDQAIERFDTLLQIAES